MTSMRPTPDAYLAGLRGIAACCVLLFHYTGFNSTNPVMTVISTAVSHFYIAVDVFLVLSGFVLAMTYHEAFMKGRWLREFPRFLLHRIARIYPLYFVTTLICFSLAVLSVHLQLGADTSLSGIAANLFMVQLWTWPGVGWPDTSLNPPGWSISRP
jgi:peptidoglycan/LPS O-acetylase OafA/YrhL